MIKINLFPFNDFQINTYILTADNKDCIIIDPGCYYENEKNQLVDFILNNKLQPKYIFNTHGHIDHVLGNRYIKETFNIPIYLHKDDEFIYNNAKNQGIMYGFNIDNPPSIDQFVNVNENLNLGNEIFKLLHVPGHSPGSVAIYSETNKFVIAGDVLFQGSIGRTDLPGGNYQTLIQSIHNQLLTLDDNVVVYPGHGSSTTIGNERNSNPFLI